jgi:SSS family solute:Na+ symporter
MYWRKANTAGAFASLIFGALTPIGFLLLEKSRSVLPSWLSFVTDVNIAGLLSFVLAGLGIVIGSIVTQRTSPPILLTPKDDL